MVVRGRRDGGQGKEGWWSGEEGMVVTGYKQSVVNHNTINLQ